MTAAPTPHLSRFLLFFLLIHLCSAQSQWFNYSNDRFGYSVALPPGLQVSNRAADGSGLTWQTGTVRVQVSGVNNPYKIKPQEYFAGVKAAAGEGLVRERQGSGQDFYWYEVLFTKDSRRIHRKVFIASGSINTVEFSYAYRLREQKEALGDRVLGSFRPGVLTQGY